MNAPAVWPKSSLSSNASGIAPQATSTNGPPRRSDNPWTVLASLLFPVPGSPVIKILALESATRSISSNTSRILLPDPNQPPSRPEDFSGLGVQRAECKGPQRARLVSCRSPWTVRRPRNKTSKVDVKNWSSRGLCKTWCAPASKARTSKRAVAYPDIANRQQSGCKPWAALSISKPQPSSKRKSVRIRSKVDSASLFCASWKFRAVWIVKPWNSSKSRVDSKSRRSSSTSSIERPAKGSMVFLCKPVRFLIDIVQPHEETDSFRSCLSGSTETCKPTLG